MSGDRIKMSISNRTDNRRDHRVRYMITSQGRAVSDMKTLKAGDSAELEIGDRLIIISDRQTNYAIRWENGALLAAEQVNNSHPKFPELTVATYRLASASYIDNSEGIQTSGAESDGGDPDDGNGPGPIIIVTEPDQPEP